MNPTHEQDITGCFMTEEKLGFLFVKEKILTEAQLKTALDFQKAVGKPLIDVIVSLQFVKRAILESVLEKHGVQEIQENVVGGVAEVSAPPPAPEPAPAPVAEAPPARPPAFSAPRNGAGEGTEGSSHTAIILDVLLRVLIRKGLIDSDEIKRELQNIEAAPPR